MTENNDKNKERPQNKNLMPPMKKGETRNPNGRPKGQKNYKTLYREALIKIGESKGMTADEIEQELHKTGINRAMRGDATFYKDVMNRVHGKPVQPVEQTVDLNVKLSEEEKAQLDKILDYNGD